MRGLGRCRTVTWRNSSSRSLAARAKLTTLMPAPIVRASSSADSSSSPRNPISIWPSSRIAADATRASAAKNCAGGLDRFAVAEDPDPQHRPVAKALLDVGHAALGEYLAVIDDGDARAELLELGKDVAADHDRLAERPELAEELAQLDPGPRIEAGRRLVEEQDLRVVDERVGEAQPLLHAPREALDVRVALVAEIDEVEEVADHPPPPIGRDAVAAGEEVEILPDLHVVVDAEDVRHEAEDAACLRRGSAARRSRRSRPRRTSPTGASRGSAAWSSCRPRSVPTRPKISPSATSRSRPATARVPA